MSNIYTSVAKNILNYCKEKDLQFGDKLPSERSLSSLFDVSRSSVREAVRFLSNKGILCSRRGDGTYLAMPQRIEIGEPFFKALNSGVASKDVFQFRYILEPEIAALAALNASPEQVNNLKIIAFDMANDRLKEAEVTALDLKFHLAIAKCTGNGLLINLTDCLGEVLALSRSSELDLEVGITMATKAHFKIVEAIAEGDPERAKKAMKEHIKFVEIRVHGENKIID